MADVEPQKERALRLDQADFLDRGQPLAHQSQVVVKIKPGMTNSICLGAISAAVPRCGTFQTFSASSPTATCCSFSQDQITIRCQVLA